MNPPDRDDLPRDAVLREALRHAPDADVAPPAALGAAILRAAQSSVPRRVPWLERLSAAWGWLAQPPVAGSLAGLMVVTVAAVVWREAPRDDGPIAAVPQSAHPAARSEDRAAPASAPVQAPAATAAPAEVPAAPPPPMVLARPAHSEAQPRVAAADAPSALEAPPARVIGKPAAPPVAAAAKEAQSPPALAEAEARVAPPVQDQAPPIAQAAPAAEAPSAAAPVVERARRRTADPLALSKGKPEAADAAGGVSGLTGGVRVAAPSGGDPLAALLDDIAAQPERWSLQRDDEPPRAMGAAPRAWLQALSAATRGRWQGAAATPAHGSAVRLFKGGQLLGVIRLAGGAVTVETPREPIGPRSAALDGDTAARLAASLEQALR